MENNKKIGMIMIAVAAIVAAFGIWLKSYNDKLAQVRIEETGTCYLTDGTCLHTNSDVMLYVTFGIAIVIVLIGFYLFLKKKDPQKTKIVIKKIREEKKEEFVQAPKTLTPETKNIFDIIAQSNGAILQGELISQSGMDKVKVSRILDKLEMQGLVERRRHGMSNLVVLKKK
jgi:uncharacterized membrane protein